MNIIKNYIEVLNNHIGGDQQRKKHMKEKKNNLTMKQLLSD